MIFLTDIAKKYGIYLLLGVLLFAAGRYTMRSTTEKYYEAQYQKKQIELDESYKKEYAEKSKTLEQQFLQATQEIADNFKSTEKITIKKPDGTVVVKEKTTNNVRKSTKTETASNVIKKETTVDSTVETKKTAKETSEQTATKSVTKTTPPPSWRVYTSTAVSSSGKKHQLSYGAGFMGDIGPLNVGAFGLIRPEDNVLPTEQTFGLTFGVSF